MRKLLTVMILTLCAAAGAYAQDSQPVQVFACDLNEGKSVSDVMALAEAYRTAWPSIGITDEGAGAFVWTSFREGTPYDYIVGFINSSLNDAAAGVQSYYGSGLGTGLDAQFQDVGTCDSAIVFSEQIKDGVILQTNDDQPDAVVEGFTCNFVDGADMDDIKSAEEYWRKQVADLNSDAANKFEAYRWTPYRGGNGTVDFLWVGNYPDLATWAQGETDYLGSKQGQAADDRLAEVSSCVSGMWMGYWIVAPTVGPTAE